MLEMLFVIMKEFLALMSKIFSQMFMFCFISEMNLKSGPLCAVSEGLSMGMFKSSTDFIYHLCSEYSGLLFSVMMKWVLSLNILLTTRKRISQHLLHVGKSCL
jgi:hypothetical protein